MGSQANPRGDQRHSDARRVEASLPAYEIEEWPRGGGFRVERPRPKTERHRTALAQTDANTRGLPGGFVNSQLVEILRKEHPLAPHLCHLRPLRTCVYLRCFALTSSVTGRILDPNRVVPLRRIGNGLAALFRCGLRHPSLR